MVPVRFFLSTHRYLAATLLGGFPPDYSNHRLFHLEGGGPWDDYNRGGEIRFERLDNYREMENRRGRFSDAAWNVVHKAHNCFGNFTNPNGHHNGYSYTFPFVQLAQAYVQGVEATDNRLYQQQKQFECEQLALALRVMEELYLGRVDWAA